MTPASPWIGSSSTATVSSVIAASSALEVAEGHGVEARREGAEVVARDRVVGEADDRRRAAVEVAGHDDDARPAVGHALDLVAPAAGGLDRRLDGLGAGVHRQHEVLAGEGREVAAEGPEPVVVEGAARQGEAVELGARGGDERRVQVAEVEGGVAGEGVEVAPALDVGDPGALGVRDDDGQRVVVARQPGPPRGRCARAWGCRGPGCVRSRAPGRAAVSLTPRSSHRGRRAAGECEVISLSRWLPAPAPGGTLAVAGLAARTTPRRVCRSRR